MEKVQKPTAVLVQYTRIFVLIVGIASLSVQFFAAPSLEPALAWDTVHPQAQAGTIRILPSSVTVGVGQTVTLDVWLEDVADYYGLDFRFYFDPSLVSVPSEQVTPLWEVFDPGSHWIIKNQADNVNGTIWYAITNLNPAEPFTGTGRICSITFSGLVSGTTALDLYYAKGSTRHGEGLYPTQVDGTIVVQPVNPTLTITSLSPISATAGSPAFTLTVNGTGFVSGSTVHWEGSARTTTFISSTQLTAAITADNIATAGMVNVTVVNPAPGGGVSNALPFEITEPSPEPSSSFIYLPLVLNNNQGVSGGE